MPTSQTGRNRVVSYKPEVTFGTYVTGGSGYQFRANAGGGLRLARPEIRSNEMSADGMTSMSRLGSRTVTGGWPADLSVGTFDPLFEAMFRGTFTAAVAITQATMTSITTQAGPPSTITAAAGSWLTQGVRVGDVIRLTNHSTAANNSRNLNVTAVTALVITVAESLTTDATPDTTFTVTILKKLIQGVTRRSFTFDDYAADLDLSKAAAGCRIASMRITGQPDGMAILELGLVGADMTSLASGASPSLTTPTLTTSIALTWLDATIRVGAAARTNLTAFSLSMDNTARGLGILGSTVTPDIWENPTVITGSFSSTIPDYADLTAFVAETEFEFHALLVEPEAEPKDCIKLFMARCKYTGFDDPDGSDGPQIATLPFTVGKKGTGFADFDNSMITLSTSAA